MKEIMKSVSLASLTVILLTACGDNFRNGHAPGDIEALENATVYHLADGGVIHERHNGSDQYHLVEATTPDYELKPEGLEVEFSGDWKGSAILERQPEDYVSAFITLVPGEGPEGTRFGIDSLIIEEIIEGFSSATTVEEIYQRKK